MITRLLVIKHPPDGGHDQDLRRAVVPRHACRGAQGPAFSGRTTGTSGLTNAEYQRRAADLACRGSRSTGPMFSLQGIRFFVLNASSLWLFDRRPTPDHPPRAFLNSLYVRAFQ